MNLGRFNRYTLADAMSGAQMRERTMHLRRRFGALNASHVFGELPYRMRETKFLVRIGAGIAAVILLIVVYSSSSSPAAPAAASMFSSPAGVVTSPTTAPTIAPAQTSTHTVAGAAHRVTATTHAKPSAAPSITAHPRTTSTTPATPTKPASTATAPNTPTVVKTTTVTTPAQTTTTVQTVTVTTPAPPTSTPAETTSTPSSSTPPLGTMTESTFKGLLVNQITRGVIATVFGKPATTKQLQDALGGNWLNAAVKGLPSGTSCSYYFDRSGKAQTFQLCFDSTNMLVLKQALKDSTASGSA